MSNRFSATLVAMGVALSLSACVEYTPPSPAPGGPSGQVSRGGLDVASFTAVVRRMEPVAEAECRARLSQGRCDYKIQVDRRAGQPPNAFQSVDSAGNPTITFTVALIAEVENRDELAFVMGHEAAHHIAGHLQRTQATAAVGGIAGGLVAVMLGGDQATVDALQNVGASVGARTYSKAFELEADQLGTVITAKAGYNPVRGAAYFTRIPDPGDRFLGTHPPNAQRIETVKRTMAGL